MKYSSTLALLHFLRMLSLSPAMTRVRDFLSHEECQEILNHAAIAATTTLPSDAAPISRFQIPVKNDIKHRLAKSMAVHLSLCLSEDYHCLEINSDIQSLVDG
jgi:hypothetical protein